MRSALLLVEGSVELLDCYEYLLSLGDKYDILTAQSGEEALRQFIANRDRIFLVLTDGRLPNNGALWLIQEIQKLNSVPVVLFSTDVSLLESDPRFRIFERVFDKFEITLHGLRSLVERYFFKDGKSQD